MSINKSETEKIYKTIYRELFDSVLKKEIENEQKFEKTVIVRAAVLCRKAMLDSDPQCLKIPKNMNFLIDAEPDISLSPALAIISAMPPLQRFIFILRRCCALNDSEISKIIRLDISTMRTALNAERKNLEALLSKYALLSNSTSTLSAKEYAEQLFAAETDISIPAQLDADIISELKSQLKPLKNRRKNIIKLCCVLIPTIIILLCVTIFLIKSSEKRNISSNSPANIESTASSADDITPTAYAEIDIKDYGIITVALDGNSAPATVENFSKLANSGFYNGLTFHRIIDGFMMQGGDPNADGTGGSDETVSGEFSSNDFNNRLSHTRGAISMARSSSYDSASSQFFIVQSDSTQLDGDYAAFGYVTDGMDIVDKICKEAAPDADNGLQEKENQPIINSITVKSVE